MSKGSVPENGSSEGFSAVSDTVQENIRPATEPLNVNQSKDPVSNFFYDVENAPLWNVYKRNHSGHSSAEACSGVSSRQASKNIPEAMVKETVLSNHDNVTIINELLPTSSAMHQEESTAMTTSYLLSHSVNDSCNVMLSSSSHNRAMLPPSLVQRNNTTTSPTTDSASEHNESVPSLTSSVSTSSSVYSSWNPPHSPHISSFPDGNFTSLNAEVTCFDFRRTKDSRTKETNESIIPTEIYCPINSTDHHKHYPGREYEQEACAPAPCNQNISCSVGSTAEFSQSNHTLTTVVPSYMQSTLTGHRTGLKAKWENTNIDYDSLEFKFERKMIAVQYLLLDEQSEPRRYYNPSNKSIPFWKRPFNFDTMPSYDQLMEEAERRFYSYQYKYEGFQRIEPYSIFCPWKNTQREIDLETSLDTLDSKVDPNIQIKPYQIFPSNNLVYEGLPHPAEQSLILSPDTSLIERAFQALIDICKESIPSSNDCTTRNTKSAPQLTVPEPSRPCRLLLVRESRTATELETNKKLWLHSKRRNIEVTVPMHPSEHGTKAGYENGSQLHQ
ncbi:hypothetical protein GRS66_004515 [Saccharomyces pastorianus]|uniref:Uncharacterized protein n=1 Tax=Saccharomyces pastorianus TaxID=27292 RepID=A0A6C1DYH3_SACPS|nr:hypothetical protein GRS66_004515 [Saccharomyces pastorianus]